MFDVITFGSATFDIFLEEVPLKKIKSEEFLTGCGLCFPLGLKISVGQVSYFPGGGSVNTSITFSRQGLKTLAVFNLGKDALSREIGFQLKKEKVSFLEENFKEDYRVPISVILLSKDGSRTILHTKRRHSFDFSLLKKLPPSFWFYLAPFTGEGAKIKDKNFLIKLIKKAKKEKIFLANNPSIFDIKLYQEKPYLLKEFDVFILNQEEASLLTGVSFKKEKEIFKKLLALTRGIVIMTQGRKGAIVSDRKYLYRLSVFKEKKIKDRTGAGDGFGSGFVAFLAKTRKEVLEKILKGKKANQKIILEALRFASANATSIIEKVGAWSGALGKNWQKEKRFKNLKIKIESCGQ